MSFHLPAAYKENSLKSSDATGADYWSTAKVAIQGDVYQADVYRIVGNMAGPTDVVIDIGCGDGAKLRRFVAPRVRRAIGVDQPSGIVQAQRRASGGDWIAGDLESDDKLWLGLGELAPDLVVCCDVIEHVADPDSLLERLRNLTRRDGRLIISTPDRATLYPPLHAGPPSNPLHVREWTAAEFNELLNEHGFRVHSCQHVLNRDRFNIYRELRAIAWQVTHGQRPGRRRSCMVFICDHAEG